MEPRLAASAFFVLCSVPLCAGAGEYPWLSAYDPVQSIEKRMDPPKGFVRVKAEKGSFGAWLRGLPLKAGRPPVLLFDGRKKARQDVHHAVIDIDVGKKDLQQCADAVIRLRAEYLFAKGRARDAAFHFTSGDECPFGRWAEGERPTVVLDKVIWTRSGRAGTSHDVFRDWLDTVFRYAGTRSVDKELLPVGDPSKVEIGDVFIEPGSPGHAVIVVDLAVDAATGGKAFLLAQSYMPAQEMHVLVSPDPISPWYAAGFGDTLATPEWKFKKEHHKRFSGQ
ncbi:MAG: DUF4846 domain-containing protein [Deltaproteobacteria bacterium]|nr:DUF4846 domain-containing protein [Deltaproteobacteria bacterium]